MVNYLSGSTACLLNGVVIRCMRIDFSELLVGYPLNESGLSAPLKFSESHKFQFTVTFFMKQYVSR